jgi:hypothetical protein
MRQYSVWWQAAACHSPPFQSLLVRLAMMKDEFSLLAHLVVTVVLVSCTIKGS